MSMFGKLFGGKSSRQKQLDAQEKAAGSLRSGQKTKVPKTKKKKKVSAMESVEGNRPSYWD